MKRFKVTYKTHQQRKDSRGLFVWHEDKHSHICQEHEIPGIKFIMRKRNTDVRITQIVEPGQPKPKSKAQLKRESDNRRRMVEVLEITLEPFYNLYLEQSYKYQVRCLEANVRKGEEDLAEAKANAASEQTIYWIQKRIDRNRQMLQLDAKLGHETYLDAHKSYTAKFNKLVDKLMVYGFTTRLKVAQVSSEDPRELSFLVQEGDREVHARLILAWGPIIRPHYRFITTERAIQAY